MAGSGTHMKSPDLWREMHRPSVDNPVCECAGGHVCCPCTLLDALEELARLRASHARLLRGIEEQIALALCSLPKCKETFGEACLECTDGARHVLALWGAAAEER